MSKKSNVNIKGLVKQCKYGLSMEVIEYKNKKNVTVQFSDGLVVNTTYKKFEENKVREPIYLITEATKDSKTKVTRTVVASEKINDEISTLKVYNSKNGKKNFRVGELHKANNGQEFRIVAYENNSHISIMFEDGTIVNNRKYCHIKNGEVRNPSLHRRKIID